MRYFNYYFGGDFGHQWETWDTNGRLGTPTGDLGHQRETWDTNGRLGTPTGDLGHQRKTWDTSWSDIGRVDQLRNHRLAIAL